MKIRFKMYTLTAEFNIKYIKLEKISIYRKEFLVLKLIVLESITTESNSIVCKFNKTVPT